MKHQLQSYAALLTIQDPRDPTSEKLYCAITLLQDSWDHAAQSCEAMGAELITPKPEP